MTMTMTTIIIASLNGIRNEPNRDEFLSINASQASWIGSITFLALPFSCVASGILSGKYTSTTATEVSPVSLKYIFIFKTDLFGRKRALLFSQIPYTIGWIMLYKASEFWQIIVGFLFNGVAIGLSESVIFTFLGESRYFDVKRGGNNLSFQICFPFYNLISQSSIRSILVSFTSLVGGIGGFVILSLNTLIPWRTIALACSAMPIIAAVGLLFVSILFPKKINYIQ